MLPRRHERTYALQPVKESKHAAAALAAIVKGVGTGDLTPGEAKALVALVEAALKGIEIVDHERRTDSIRASTMTRKNENRLRRLEDLQRPQPISRSLRLG